MMLSHFDSWAEVLDHLKARNTSEAVIKAAAVVWDDFVMSPAFPVQRLELDFEPPTLTTREVAEQTGYSEVYLRQEVDRRTAAELGE